MNKKQFNKLQKSLIERGYRIYDQHWHHEDYVLGKGFHRKDNVWDEDRNAYQILISVYDWTDDNKDFYTRLPDSMRHTVGLEVHVDMSRTIDEAFNLVFPFHDNDTIEEIERIAKAYYNAMRHIVPKPRQEHPIIE